MKNRRGADLTGAVRGAEAAAVCTTMRLDMYLVNKITAFNYIQSQIKHILSF